MMPKAHAMPRGRPRQNFFGKPKQNAAFRQRAAIRCAATAGKNAHQVSSLTPSWPPFIARTR